jgi:hypothetical protein
MKKNKNINFIFKIMMLYLLYALLTGKVNALFDKWMK